MREGLKELAAQRANQQATQVVEGLQPVKDGSAPHLAKLAKEVGDQGGSVTTGRVTVRSEGPSKDEAKGAPAKPEAVPADHHRLTIELQPISQTGSTPATPRVLSLVVDDKTGKLGGSTIGGKTATEQEVNAFLVEAQQAAKPVPTANSQPGTNTQQGGASTTRITELTADGKVGPEETRLLQEYLKNKKFAEFINRQGFEDKDGQLTTVVQVQKKPLQISLNKTSGSLNILFDGQSTSETEHIKLAEELINRQINAFKANLVRSAQPAPQK